MYRRSRRPRRPMRRGGTSSNERIAAVFTHAGIIVLPVILPLIIWLTHKDVSAFVNYQAKQATLYQLCLVVVAILFPWPMLLLVWVPAAIFGFYAAYQCNQGLSFRYPVIGDLVA